ncbi:MAG: rod shape-determining protein RodA [Lachnospiraceae bacterium]|nr:rod shape-determining protein RodA [Lachnospiraceae bacterium]
MIFKFRDYKLRFFNLRILLYVAILCFMGVQFVGSASANTADPSATMMKQVVGIALGVVMMLIVSLVDYHFLLRMGLPVWIVTIAILVGVRLFGATYNNARRWIEILGGRVSIQPSELCKILLIIVFAALFARCAQDQKISKLPTIAQALIVMAVPVGLIMLQPDLSTSLVIVAVFAVMFFVAGLNYKIIGVVLTALGAGIAGIMVYAGKIADPATVSNYQIKRIMAWLNPELFPDIVYQQTNSIMAIGNGGMSGMGLFNTTLEAVKNGNYLSEQDTDFIFAVVGEEVGFVGSCAIIILIVLLILECLYLAYKAKDMGGRLICTGYAGILMFQSFFNIGVATGLLPNTGLPLPFLSAGLSSIVSLFIGLGLVLNVGMQREISRSSSGSYEP